MMFSIPVPITSMSVREMGTPRSYSASVIQELCRASGSFGKILSPPLAGELPARIVTIQGVRFFDHRPAARVRLAISEISREKPSREIAFDCCQPRAGFVWQNRERKR
jgi:hypothetical protein